HCLTSFLDFIHQNLDKRNTSLAVAFINFRKAFDLVDHTIIIRKAITLGLQPNLVSWLADFLSDRSQAVRYQGSVSTPQHLTCGVPQGTKMGPLCFLILINDALNDTQHRWKYVDDSTVGMTVDNRAPDYTSLQSTLDTLQTWTVDNNVTINHTKSVVMHFNTAKKQVQPPSVSIGPHPLHVVQSVKLLGITLDDKLNWKKHVSTTVKAASYRLYMLRRLRTLGTPTTELRSIYNTFILPKLMYASPAWSSSINVTQKRQLERVQKRACRIILGQSYLNYENALTTLNLPNLTVLHLDALKRFGMNLLSNPRHQNLLPARLSPSTRTTRHHNTLEPIKAPRTDRYKNSAIPTIVSIINNLKH
ncbi:MAG: hypothetical protein GY938_06290, partial [Ketobacter sp.]|nr:hypothetical protein [Ketobacter sp.]